MGAGGLCHPNTVLLLQDTCAPGWLLKAQHGLTSILLVSEAERS